MYLQLNHQKLEIYLVSRKLVSECYRMTQSFPGEEKYALTSQIRRAALSAHLNIAEGASRKSGQERKRFFEVSRGSLVEIDGALDIASDLGYFKKENFVNLGELLLSCFKLITKLINKTD